MSRATINDVAREANVSKKTVSRVLNQEPNVHLDTRQRVLDAMNKQNLYKVYFCCCSIPFILFY